MTKRKVRDFNKVKVFYYDCPVRYVKDLMADRGSTGECSYRRNLIDIDDGVDPFKNCETIIHEMLHKAIETIEPDLNEEPNILKFTNAFLTLIKDNKELFEAIINEI